MTWREGLQLAVVVLLAVFGLATFWNTPPRDRWRS